MTFRRVLPAFAVVAITFGAAACGSDQPASSDSLPPAVTTPSSSIGTADTIPPAETVEIVGVYEGAEFYPACGNETLDHQGVTWYTLVNAADGLVDPAFRERADVALSADREPSPVMGRQGLVRVVSPGPGDDVGTLVVWADGVARWVSDSGDLDVWLIDEELTYNWVC